MQTIAPYYRNRFILVNKSQSLKNVLNSKPFRFGMTDSKLNHLIKNGYIKVWGKYGFTSTINDYSIVQYNQHIHESSNNLPKLLSYVKVHPYNPKGLIVIDKPNGCVVHPVQKYYYGTIQKQLERETGLRYNCVNRLDKLTSGLLIMANEEWTKRLKNEDWTKEKLYFVLVNGKFPVSCQSNDDLVYIYLTRNLIKTFTNSQTDFQLLKFQNGQSLILAKLGTGFPHQIRIHLRNLGFPVIGDSLYSSDGKYREIIRNREEITDEYLELIKNRSDEIQNSKRIPKTQCNECLAYEYHEDDPEITMKLHAWKYSWRNQNGEGFYACTEIPIWVKEFLKR